MNADLKRELIVKTAMEVLQNVMPTNIVENLQKFNEEEDDDDIADSADDLDEDRFFFQLKNRYQLNNQENLNFTSNTEQTDKNDSLTYFEIVEQEMMQSLPVTKESIGVRKMDKFSFVTN